MIPFAKVINLWSLYQTSEYIRKHSFQFPTGVIHDQKTVTYLHFLYIMGDIYPPLKGFKMNLDVLKEITTNNPEILEQSAKDNGLNEITIVDIDGRAVKSGYNKLTTSEKKQFDNCIKPLIENIQCPGYKHELDEVGRECESILNDDDLLEYYQHGKYCESCEAQASADAHSKESIMRD